MRMILTQRSSICSGSRPSEDGGRGTNASPPRASSTWRCASPSRPRCSGSASSSADRERSRIAQGVPRIRPLASGPAVFALALPDDEKQRKMRALKYTRQDSNLQSSVPTFKARRFRNSPCRIGDRKEKRFRFPMTPTVFRDGPFRFFFFSREEARIHVHVSHPDGEATFLAAAGS